MSTNIRVRELRKTLGLNQTEFGDKLGVKTAAISKIEKGENALTEQMTLAICREFGVNYEWLKDGIGDKPFVEKGTLSDLDLFDTFMDGEDEFAKETFRAFARMKPDSWKQLRAFMEDFVSNHDILSKK